MFRRSAKVRPVNLQPRVTPIVAAPFFRLKDEVFMAAPAVIGDTSIILDDVSNLNNDTHLILTDGVTGAFHIADVIGDVYAGNEVTIDTPLGRNFGTGSFVTVGDHDMRTPVGSLAAPIKYQVRTPLVTQAEVAYDVHRLMLQGITTAVGDLANFGDGDPLINGMVLRVAYPDGTYHNIGNAKTNGGLKQMMYDFDILSAVNAQQGANGIAGRFSVDKLGGVFRLAKGYDLEILVQDDLTSRVLSFGILTQGGIANKMP